MRSILLGLLIVILVSQYRPADTSEPKKVEPERPKYVATLHVTISGEKVAKAGISRFDVAEAFNGFLGGHARFKLSEFQAVKVGGTPLSELATIDVEFEPLPSKNKEASK